MAPSPPFHFSISSPSSAQRISTPLSLSQRRVDFDLVDGISTFSRPPQTPNSISTSASSFARRLDQVSSFAALAATSDADPGVRDPDEETARLVNHSLADDGAMLIPPRPVCAYEKSLMPSILTIVTLTQAPARPPGPKDSQIQAMTNARKISPA